MKRIMGLVAAIMIILSSAAYAGGDQNHGSKGQGSTGTSGNGSTTQNRGN